MLSTRVCFLATLCAAVVGRALRCWGAHRPADDDLFKLNLRYSVLVEQFPGLKHGAGDAD